MRIIGEDTIVTNDVANQEDSSASTPLQLATSLKQSLEADDDTPVPKLDPVLIRLLILTRSLRHKHFGSDLDQDPSWTMLLELAWADLQGREISITSLCIGSGSPDTTALRYIKILEDDGFIARTPDKHDRRRSFVYLTPSGRKALAEMLGELRIKASRLIADFI